MLRIAALLAAVLLAAPAFAQTAVNLRATIDAVSPDGATLSLHTRAGEAATLRLKPGANVVRIVKADLAGVKPGAYVGVAAVPDGDDGLKALEVHIFPEAQRGAGDGHRPFDLAPGSTMTNGAVTARLEGASGDRITVQYNGGTQSIRIPAGAPIVAFEPGQPADLKPGAAIFARAVKADDGVYDAVRVSVGKDGLVPPM